MCEAWIAISWFVPRTNFSVRIRACFTESASTCSACALTRFGRRPTAFPAAGRRERRTTKPWRESPPPWNTWRNSGGATSRRRKAKGPRSWPPTTPSARTSASLLEQLVPALLEIPGLTFYGITEPARFHQRVPTVAVRIAGRSPRELAAYLGERGIFTWDGNYYALNLSERLGVEPEGGMLRIGLVHYNTAGEVDRLLAALRKLA